MGKPLGLKAGQQLGSLKTGTRKCDFPTLIVSAEVTRMLRCVFRDNVTSSWRFWHKTSAIHRFEPRNTTRCRDIWQGRVNASWRFYFKIDENLYSLIDIIPHPK